MPTVGNVSTGKPKTTGGVWHAPLGTTLPTDATTALDAAFKNLGYCSEDGVSESTDMSTNEIKAWGGDTVLLAQEGKSYKYTFTPIECMNSEVLKAQYGSGNVTVDAQTGLITVTGNATEVGAEIFVIELALRDGGFERIVLPNGKLSSLGDITYNDTDPIGSELEITAMPDASANAFYKYILPGA